MRINKARIKYEIQENFVDATSMVTLTMPINTAIETFGADMTNQISLNSRAYNLALAYGGLTRLVKLRDYTKKKFNVDKFSGVLRGAHDAAYGVTFGPLAKIGVYLAAGETDWKKIAVGTFGSMVIIGGLSIPLGWVVDVGRDLWGIKQSVRTPEYFQNKSSSFKKRIAISALATSLAATGLIYTLNNFRTSGFSTAHKEKQSIEQLIK